MKEDKRFEIVLNEGIAFSKTVTILRDRETGVKYLYLQAGYSGGLTPLLDKDGKPEIDMCN